MCRRRAPPRITTTAAVRSAAPSAVRPGTPRRARPVPADGLRVGGVGSGGSTTRPSLTAPGGSTGAEQARRGASEKLCFAATVITRQPVAGNLVVVAGLGHEPVAGHTQPVAPSNVPAAMLIVSRPGGSQNRLEPHSPQSPYSPRHRFVDSGSSVDPVLPVAQDPLFAQQCTPTRDRATGGTPHRGRSVRREADPAPRI